MKNLNHSSLIEFVKQKHPELRNYPSRVIKINHLVTIISFGEQWIFRFPNTIINKITQDKENYLLPMLELALPTAIPHIRYAANCTDIFDYHGYLMIKGDRLNHTLLNRTEQLAEQLGKILTALHTFTWQTCNASIVHVCDTRARWSYLFQIIRQALPLMNSQTRSWTVQLFESFLSDLNNFRFTPCLIHGDLGSRHIICDHSKRQLVGIIDFEDSHVGDPAYDFAQLYWEFGSNFVNQILKYYHVNVDSRFHHRLIGFYAKVMGFWGIIEGVVTNNQAQINQSIKVIELQVQKDQS